MDTACIAGGEDKELDRNGSGASRLGIGESGASKGGCRVPWQGVKIGMLLHVHLLDHLGDPTGDLVSFLASLTRLKIGESWGSRLGAGFSNRWNLFWLIHEGEKKVS